MMCFCCVPQIMDNFEQIRQIYLVFRKFGKYTSFFQNVEKYEIYSLKEKAKYVLENIIIIAIFITSSPLTVNDNDNYFLFS